MSDSQHAPVFIHSLFRTGSTWLFDCFRRSPANYWCYQEPYHEFLINLQDQPDAVLDIHEQTSHELRHPELQRPYFYEIHAIREHIADSFTKCISFDSFFDVESCPAFAKYTGRLITHAPSRPVLQCCRSFGRIAFLQARFGGTHVHLWRNPRDQWWSYQINDYFDTTGLAILNADNPPPVILRLREAIGFVPLRRGTFAEEYAQLLQVPLNSEQRYLLFYALWFFSLCENRRLQCRDINIDRLSSDDTYRVHAEDRLVAWGIPGVDLSACAVPQATFDEAEIEQFEAIEARARHLFEDAGYPVDEVAAAQQVQKDQAPARRKMRPSALQPALAGRQAARMYANRMAEFVARGHTSARTSELPGGAASASDADMEIQFSTLQRIEDTLTWLAQDRSGAAGLLDRQRDVASMLQAIVEGDRGAAVEMSRDLQRLREEAQQMRERAEELRASISTLHAQLENEREHNRAARARIAALEAETHDLRGHLASSRERAAQWITLEAALNQQIEQARGQWHEAAARIHLQARELGELHAHIEHIELRHRVEFSSALLQQERTLTEAAQAQIERERAKVKAALNEVARLNEKLQLAQRALEAEHVHEANARSQLEAECAQRAAAEQRAAAFERQSRDLRARVSALEQTQTQAQSQLAVAQAQLAELFISRSWRLTAPLRGLRFQLKLLRMHGFMARLRSLTKNAARALLGHMFRWSETRPRARRVGAALARILGIETRLRALYQHWWLPSIAVAAPSAPAAQTDVAGGGATQASTMQEDAALSPRARQIKFWLDATRRDHLGGR